MVDSEIIGAVIGPLLTALLAVLAYAFQQWRGRRRWQGERDRAIAQAIQEVQYIDTWLSALGRLQRIDPEHEQKLERALVDLERSYHVMSLDLAEDDSRPRRRSLAQHIGWFLLVPIHGTGAKVVRVLYWILLSLALIWVMAVFATIPENLDQGIGMAILASVVLNVLAVLPAILVAVWARHLDRRTLARLAASRGAVPQAPAYGPFQVPQPGYPDPRAPYPPDPQQWR